MGDLFGKPKDPMEEAAEIQQEQLERLSGISLPELQKLMLESPELVGLLEAEQLGPSAMEDIRVDPRFQEAQMRALAELEERGEVGLTPEDRARLGEITRGTEAAAQARQKGILQQMAERGQLDSGAQLIAQLQASGEATQRASQAGEQLAAQAAAARRQALQQAGGMAGQMGAQQFGQQAQQASARDRIQQFNLGQRANVQQQNLAARQAIANQQADVANRQQMYNVQLPQQQFQNQMTQAGAMGGATSNLAQIAAQTPAELSGMQKLGTLAGAAGGAYFGGPAGMSAGAQAGGAIGGMFEDGGVARNPADRLEKKKYNGNYYQQDDAPKYQDGGLNPDPMDAQLAQRRTMQSENIAPRSPMIENIIEARVPEQDDMAALQGLNRLLGAQNAPRLENGGISYASDGMGGIVEVEGVESFAGDRIDAKLNEGEAVLNIPQQQRLMDMIRGEISPAELGNEDIIEGVPKNYRDELHQEVEQPVKKKSAKDQKIEGLEKLLQALGK